MSFQLLKHFIYSYNLKLDRTNPSHLLTIVDKHIKANLLTYLNMVKGQSQNRSDTSELKQALSILLTYIAK